MSYDPTSSRNRQRQSRSSSQYRSMRSARYEDPFSEDGNRHPRETRRASAQTNRTSYYDGHNDGHSRRSSSYAHSENSRRPSYDDIDDYRDHSRYTSRSSSGRSHDETRHRTAYADRQSGSHSYEHSRSSASASRRRRAESLQQSSARDAQSRRPLIICIIILLVLDIALAVGIYSCGASYDAQATSNTAQTTQASQTGQTTAQSNHT